MERDEILRKSRNEKNDEGVVFINTQGRKIGVIGMMIIFIVLSIYYLYTNHADCIYPLLAMVFGYLTFESAGIFNVTKKKSALVKAITGFLLCLTFLAISMI